MDKWISLMALCTLGTLNAELYFSPEMRASHLVDYSEEELQAIDKDLAVVRSVCLPNASTETPVYLATAGAPGARKTTTMELFLRDNPSLQPIAYLDPDQRSLKFMVHTYYARSLSVLALNSYDNYFQASKAAYEKWRGASSYIALTLLEEAFEKKCSIAHGSTSTGAHVGSFFPALKQAGYTITLLLCSCEDALRFDAVQYRNNEQKFYQSTPEDALSKGKLFPERLPIYLQNADQLYLYWSDALDTPPLLAASLSDGSLHINDPNAYFKFLNKYEADRQQLQSESKCLLAWDELLTLYQERWSH